MCEKPSKNVLNWDSYAISWIPKPISELIALNWYWQPFSQYRFFYVGVTTIWGLQSEKLSKLWFCDTIRLITWNLTWNLLVMCKCISRTDLKKARRSRDWKSTKSLFLIQFSQLFVFSQLSISILSTRVSFTNCLIASDMRCPRRFWRKLIQFTFL